jgi:predicted phage terminase large subunit-like protein
MGLASDPDEIAFDRAYVKRFGLYGFVRLAWHRIEPASAFVDGWHIEEVCNHLEAVTEGVFRNLVINVPPGTSKSKITSVCWTPWAWIDHPEKKWIFVSYSPTLSTRDARACRELIESEWYQERWPTVQILEQDRADNNYRNNHGGWRFSSSVRGEITGRHPDVKVVDDPIKAILTQGTAAITRTEIDFVNKNFWDGTMSTRAADPKKVANVIIMQRLHDDDLSGHCLESGTYEHLCLPMRFDAERPCRTIIGGDHRTQPGQLLCPDRFGEEEVKKLERELGVYADAQLQQRPSREGGQIFRVSWFKFWTHLPAQFDEVLSSWDMTFKDTLGSDFVCGQVWRRLGADFYLVDQVYERLNFPNTLTAFEAQCRRYPEIGAKLVEDKANGPAVIATLQKKISGLIARTPLGTKVTRANGMSYLHRAGNVLYPDPKLGEQYAWVRDHMRNMQGFPLARHDDDVDAETQALAYFAEQHNALFDALGRMAQERQGNELPVSIGIAS